MKQGAVRAQKLAKAQREEREEATWREYQQDKQEDPESDVGEEGEAWGARAKKEKEEIIPPGASVQEVFENNVAFLTPGAEFKAPSQQESSRIRQGYGVLSLLHAAIVLATCVSYTLHSDLSTKMGLKLGTAVLRCQMADGSFKLVVLGGLFTQSEAARGPCL